MNGALLQRVRERLDALYGARLKGVVLYGSEARGDADADSDIDIMVLLDGPIALWRETRAIVEALYDIQLEVIRPLHATPVDFKSYQAQEYALYRNAKRDGKAA